MFDFLKTDDEKILKELKSDRQKIDKAEEQNKKLRIFTEKAPDLIDKIEEEFINETKLTKEDLFFVLVATALQCLRLYFMNSLTKTVDDQSAARFSHNIHNRLIDAFDDNDTSQRWYWASKSEILHPRVPFDIMAGSKINSIGGPNKGISGINHRTKTLGHDPLYGWIFGTANIMTNTMTTDMFETCHVKNSLIGPSIVTKADLNKTAKMFKHFYDRSSKEPFILALCVLKEALHLQSDLFTKKGIALPGSIYLDGKMAQRLCDYGLTTGKVMKDVGNATISMTINNIVSYIHYIYNSGNIDNEKLKMLQIRTKKIVLISNSIAQGSDVIRAGVKAISSYSTGNLTETGKSIMSIDFGGLTNLLHRFIEDKRFICAIESEYINSKWKEELYKAIK